MSNPVGFGFPRKKNTWALHVTVTDSPTATWTAHQILGAFPDKLPRLLLHDRDAIYGWEFNRMAKALGIGQIRSAPRSP